MASFVLWWAAAELLAFAAFPLAFLLLRSLPDRGYTAAKPLGILLPAFLFWFAGALGVTGNDRGSVLLIAAVFVLLGLALAALQREALVDFFETHLRYLLTVEALFLAIFAWFTLVRAFVPEIEATEKQFELAFLNGVSRTPYFPPPDTWLSGHVMNYYYFGWVNVDFIDRLTQTVNSVGFNLGTPLTAALAAVTMFGLVFSLARALSPLTRHRWAAGFGLLAVVLLLFISNLEGVLELLAAHHVGSAGFYSLIGIEGLDARKTTSTWYPNEFWFWWRATRMGSGYNIMEFPYFSFMLGDLHPHVMVMPFTLLAFVFGWDLLAGEHQLDGRFWSREPLYLLVLGVLIGALGLLNAWDQPVALLLIFALALIANRRRFGSLTWPCLRASVLFLLPLLALGVILFLPYWGVFEKTDIVGISAIMISGMAPNPARDSMATPPLHLLLFWGPLFWLLLSFLAVHMRRTHASQLPVRYALLPLALACIPLGLWAVAIAGHAGVAGLAGELATRGGGLLTEVMLTLLLYLSLAALMRELAPQSQGDEAEPVQNAGSIAGSAVAASRTSLAVVFALVCTTIALLWILGAELFYVVESSFALRYNTVFKLWIQSWELGAIGAALGAAYILKDLRKPALVSRPARLAWSAATVALLLAALVYPIIATANRTNGLRGPLSLDGLAYFRRDYPADYAAAAWLSENARGTPVVLEAEGGNLAGNFSAEGARISELSGLPTVLGWLEHEQIHHGILAPLQLRSNDIKTVYTTPDPLIARSILQQYGVQYVVVGDLERRVYGDAGLLKFPQMGATVYRAPGMAIYDVTQPPAFAGVPSLPAAP
jgi:YYY domain-containing protein